MGEIWQEMYCSECHSYFGFMLCSLTKGDVEIICGICKHKHARYVNHGRIDGEAKTDKYVMTIEVMRSACYPESRTAAMQKAERKREAYGKEGQPGELSRPMTHEESARQSIINELWLDKYAREISG